MNRTFIREVMCDKIELDLEEKETVVMEYYQKLRNLGVRDSNAIETLAFYYELFNQETENIDELDNQKFKEFLDKLPLINHEGEYVYDKQDEKRNLRNIKRNYGALKSDVEIFEDELFNIEIHLMILHNFFLINAFEARKIVNIVIDRIMNIPTQDTSDYSEYAHEDIIFLADGLEQCCNPFTSENLKDYLEEFIDVDDPDNYDKIFKNILLCLARIIESIDFWEKELGKDGYFRFISQYIDAKSLSVEGPQFIFNDETLNKEFNK